MEQKFFALFFNIQQAFFEKIVTLFRNKEIIVEMKIENDSFSNFSYVIILRKFSKTLCFNYSIGYNSSKILNSVSYAYVKNMKTDDELDLGKYNLFIGKQKAITNYGDYKSIEEESLKVNIVLNELISTVLDAEVEKLLYTDYWVNLPMDYSPYK